MMDNASSEDPGGELHRDTILAAVQSRCVLPLGRRKELLRRKRF